MARCVITEQQLNAEVEEGTRLMIMASIITAVAISVAGSLFVHLLSKPMHQLRDDFTLVGKLEQLETISDRKGLITELSDISEYLKALAMQVEKVREVLGEDDRGIDREMQELHNASFGRDGGGSDSGDFGGSRNFNATFDDTLRMQQSFSVHSTRVRVTYESRKTAEEIGSGEFDLVYADSETADLFERFVLDCKASVDENEFEEVTLMHVDDNEEQLLLRSAMQLQELLATAPKSMRIVMYKARTAQFRMLATPAADLLNAVVTIVFVTRLLQLGQNRTPTIAFTCLYIFALGMNCCITLGLLRSSSERFQRWVAQAQVEVALDLVVSTLNPQNMQLLWSQLRLGNLLRFNGPEDSKLAQRSVSWSLFGFLFSDAFQLMFKIWLLYNSNEIDVFNFFALATSGVSVAFNLVFRLHAMFLWHNTVNDPLASSPELLAEEGQLVNKNVTVVHCRFTMPAYVQLLNLQGFEYNAFYTSVFASLKAHRGSVLWAHGGDVVAVFNVQRRSDSHVADAVRFAIAAIQSAASKGQEINCAVGTGTFPVGMLGTLTNKNLHCFGPGTSLDRLLSAAVYAGAGLIMTAETAEQLLADRANFPEDDFKCVGLTKHRLDRIKGVLPVTMPVVVTNGLAGESKAYILQLPGREEVDEDFRIAQLAVATGLARPDRDKLENKLHKISTVHSEWRRAQSAFGGNGLQAGQLSASFVLKRVKPAAPTSISSSPRGPPPRSPQQ